MKKVIYSFLLLFSLTATVGNAQWINSITISPASPTSNDTVWAYVDCDFPSGGCDPYYASVYTTGTQINAGALHCLGQLSVICNYVDTFMVEPLAPGVYNFHFQLNTGGGPAPCTPGIAPGPTSSVNFTVSLASSIPPPPAGDFFSILCDPKTGMLTVEFPNLNTSEKNRLAIYSPEGKIVAEILVTETHTTWQGSLAPGVYIASLSSGNARFQKSFVVVE